MAIFKTCDALRSKILAARLEPNSLPEYTTCETDLQLCKAAEASEVDGKKFENPASCSQYVTSKATFAFEVRQNPSLLTPKVLIPASEPAPVSDAPISAPASVAPSTPAAPVSAAVIPEPDTRIVERSVSELVWQATLDETSRELKLFTSVKDERKHYPIQVMSQVKVLDDSFALTYSIKIEQPQHFEKAGIVYFSSIPEWNNHKLRITFNDNAQTKIENIELIAPKP